jgi:hypothetical protein
MEIKNNHIKIEKNITIMNNPKAKNKQSNKRKNLFLRKKVKKVIQINNNNKKVKINLLVSKDQTNLFKVIYNKTNK